MTAHAESGAPSGGAAVGGRRTLSACIIARDEQDMLPECLASVDFCDEVVLVDSGSTDATVELARAAGARVIEQPWLGFAAQRNVALDHATGQWILEVDADERVSPQLRVEIQDFLADHAESFKLVGIPRRQVFLGRALGPSAKYPEYSHRLLLRGAYRHDEARTVHEGLIPQDPVYPLEGDLLHLVADDWREVVGDAWRYARLEAAQMRTPRTPTGFIKGALLRPLAKFVYRTCVDGGWRDGWRGFARIAVDCAVDSTVWTLYVVGGGGHVGDSGVPAGAHYGARNLYRGSARIVGLAFGDRSRARAVSWLTRSQEAGADVALVSDGLPSAVPTDVRVRRVGRFRPLTVIRALDCEEQLRTIDAVVPFGVWAAVMARVLPVKVRGHCRGLADKDPAAAAANAVASRPRSAP